MKTQPQNNEADHDYMPRSSSLHDVANAALALARKRMCDSAKVPPVDVALLLGAASAALYVDHLRGASGNKVP